MKSGQLVEVDIHPTGGSIGASQEPCGGGPAFNQKNGWIAVWWLDTKGAARNSCGISNITVEGSHDEQSNRSGPNERSRRGRDLLVDSRIKINAFENVLREINPLLHERYLGEIEVVKERKASALERALTASLKAVLAQS